MATEKPEPIVADRSVEFETVTDRTPVEFRDNAAYALLARASAGKTPAELAAVSRRDVVLAHLWQNPELYRGVPIHLLGTAMRVLRYPVQAEQDRLALRGVDHHAGRTERPLRLRVRRSPARGCRSAPDVSERVVFNGYFLKIMKYQAGDVARGAPLLVGRIGWEPREPAGTGRRERDLAVVAHRHRRHVRHLPRAVGYQLFRLFTAPPVSPLLSPDSATEEIDPPASMPGSIR